jgi:hypothetical protein
MSRAAVDSEYAAYRGAGTASISGKALLTLSGGGVKPGAAGPVTLDPATEYALEWHRKVGNDGDSFERTPPDTLFKAARRTTIADADGKFEFSNLPPGKYLIRALVSWDAPGSSKQVQGAVVSSVVIVNDGRKTGVEMGRVFREGGSR